MTKKELRTQYKQKREDLTVDQRQSFTRQILDQVQANFSLDGKTGSIFLPIARLAEIDTYPFMAALNSTFYLPVVKPNNALVHIQFENEAQLKVSDWGIPEPLYGEEGNPALFDFVFVPLLIADKRGYRVGYGKGFYDRFLAQCRPDCQLIGINYFEPVEHIEDIHAQDVPLHFLVTPEKVYRF